MRTQDESGAIAELMGACPHGFVGFFLVDSVGKSVSSKWKVFGDRPGVSGPYAETLLMKINF